MAGYDIFRIKEDRRPELVFYVPHKIRDDCAVVMYPGFGRTPEDYHRAGELIAEDNTIGVITEWHDDGMFREKDMLESVYYPSDYLKKELGHKGKVVGIGHSFGAHRLLKAAAVDREKRFDGVTAVQPPETMLKYVKNHPIFFYGAQMNYVRAVIALFARFRRPGLHVRHVTEGEWLTGFIRKESSLFDFIRDAPDGYSTPTQIIYSAEDRHVSHEDSLRAKEELSRKGPAIIEEVSLPKLDAKLTDKNIETIFKHATVFYTRVARGDFKPDEQDLYRNTLGIELGLEKPEKVEAQHPTIELGDAYGFPNNRVRRRLRQLDEKV